MINNYKKIKINLILRSPGTRRKAKAPPPPPSNSSIIQTKQRIFQEKSSENEELNRTKISMNTSESTIQQTGSLFKDKFIKEKVHFYFINMRHLN